MNVIIGEDMVLNEIVMLVVVLYNLLELFSQA